MKMQRFKLKTVFQLSGLIDTHHRRQQPFHESFPYSDTISERKFCDCHKQDRFANKQSLESLHLLREVPSFPNKGGITDRDAFLPILAAQQVESVIR
jgi:hypothetical protein